MTKEITQATSIINKAKALSVTTHEEAAEVTEILSRANKALDLLEEKEAERTVRLKEELAFIKAPYTEPKKQLKEIIAHLRKELGNYQTKSIQQAVIEAEAGVKDFGLIQLPQQKVQTPSGTLSFRPKQTLKIINEKRIPRNFLMPNEDAILESIKAGIGVPGCEIEIIQVPFNRRN